MASSSLTSLQSNRAFFINSALAFAAAVLLTAALHETGHGLAAQALGFSPKIYAFYEDNPTGTPMQNLLILAAGPCTSLVLGLIFLLWLRRGIPRYTFPRLFLFWMAWGGIVEFVNYIIVTPVLRGGDTWAIADILQAPLWTRWAWCAMGIVAILRLAPIAKESMFAVAPQGVELDSRRAQRRYVMGGFYLPLLVGVVLLAPAGIGGKASIVMLGLFSALGNIDIIAATLYRRPDPPAVHGIDAALRIEPLAIGAYLVMVTLYVFVLSHGLPV
ncbi:MAG: hypothetical protein ABSE64_14485 [Vulcanimicrobiaceae bacterium]|jgi:hypothetical protein